MNFKTRVAQLIKQCSDAGMTQKEMAERLGVTSKNYISMVSGNKKDETSPLSLSRLPALVEMCGLTAREALELVFLRAKYHPENPTHFDTTVMASIMSWDRAVMRERAAKKELTHG